MNTTMRKWTAGALLALALGGLTVSVGRADDDEELKKASAAAKDAILKNLDKVGGPDMDALAAKLAKEHKIEPTMRLFKPKSKGGIGIGSLKDAGHKDSVELLIMDYARKPPTAAEVDKEKALDLLKSAQITAIIADMTPYWGPQKDVGKKTKAKWKELSDEMKKGSADLVAAAKARDAKAVGAAAQKLNTSCVDCHSIFRDDK